MRIVLLIAFLFALYSCGGAASIPVADAADLTLNTITDTVQPTYELTKNWCSAQEWSIVRSGRTASQKEAAVQKVRVHCDEIFNIFETLIRLQKDAREFVDASRRGEADAFEALAKVREIQVLYAEACKHFERLREVLQ